MRLCKIFPQLTEPSRIASTRNSDTVQSWTIPVEQQPSPVSMSFFQSKTCVPSSVSEGTICFPFQKVWPTKVMCTAGFVAFLELLGCKRAAVMHSNPSNFSVAWLATTLRFASPWYELLTQNIVGLYSPFLEPLTARLCNGSRAEMSSWNSTENCSGRQNVITCVGVRPGFQG